MMELEKTHVKIYIMKKIIILVISLTISNLTYSQNDVYSTPKTSHLSIVNSLNKSFPFFGNSSQAISNFGQPQSISQNPDVDMIEYGGFEEYKYPGITMGFEDRPTGKQCIIFEIFSNQYSVSCNNQKFKIGDPISIIESIFPESYSYMQSQGDSFIRVEYDELNETIKVPYYSPMFIEFNTSTNKITGIYVGIL